MTLSDYLEAVRGRQWGYGALDCCIFMADWLVTLGFDDPMADRRGAYSTKQEYRKLMRGEGGISKSCAERFAGIGLDATAQPAPGDVALVLAPVGIRKSGRVVSAPTGSICVSEVGRVLVTPDAGLVFADVPTVAAWSVGRG